MADPGRKGGGGLSLRTLAIASAASLAAATVTSRLFPPGTIYASALTPVIVAAVSELLNRPADRVSAFRAQRRTMVVEAQEQRIEAGESTPLGEPASALGVSERLARESSTRPAEIRVHGRQPLRRRILHPKVWVVTGLVAFAIAVAVLTLPELIFGGAVATNHRTTFFGGGGSSAAQTQTQTHTSTTPATTQTQTQTTTTITQTVPAPTTTDTTPTTTETGTQTAPTGTTPAPTDTGTSTAPAPGGVIEPPSP